MSNLIVELFHEDSLVGTYSDLKMSHIDGFLERELILENSIEVFKFDDFDELYIDISFKDFNNELRHITSIKVNALSIQKGDNNEAVSIIGDVILYNCDHRYNQLEINMLEKLNVSIRGEKEYREHISYFNDDEKFYFLCCLMKWRDSFLTIKSDLVYVVDCSNVMVMEDFFIELGITLFGVYGFCGNSINTLEDCLIEIQESDINFLIELRYFNVLEKQLGRNWYEMLLDVFNKYKIEVLLEG